MKSYVKEYEEKTGKPYYRLFGEDYPALHSLWQRRNEDTPITARELYKMLENVAEEIKHVTSMMSYS